MNNPIGTGDNVNVKANIKAYVDASNAANLKAELGASNEAGVKTKLDAGNIAGIKTSRIRLDTSNSDFKARLEVAPISPTAKFTAPLTSRSRRSNRRLP